MKHMVPWALFIVLVSGIPACGSAPTHQAGSVQLVAVPAAVIQVESHAAPVVHETVGTVRARVSSTIQSKLTGHVQSVAVKEGDTVEAGQLLVEIDSREPEAQVHRAESALQEAEAAAQEMDRQVQAAHHSLTAAEAGHELAQATYTRYKGLAENQAISRQVFDEVNAKLKGAAAEASQAGQLVSAVQARKSEMEARIQQAKAELANARTQLSFTKVTAPFSGIITQKRVDVGDLATPGNPLFVLENPQQYRLETVVDEALINSIKPGAAIPVKLDVLPAEDLTGTVSEIVPAADPVSRTFLVKLDLPVHPAIRSGVFGRARFEADSTNSHSLLTVPQTAIMRQGQLINVFVVDADNIARLRLITLGKKFGNDVEVLSGLNPGERVAVTNIEKLTDGSPVQPQ